MTNKTEQNRFIYTAPTTVLYTNLNVDIVSRYLLVSCRRLCWAAFLFKIVFRFHSFLGFNVRRQDTNLRPEVHEEHPTQPHCHIVL